MAKFIAQAHTGTMRARGLSGDARTHSASSVRVGRDAFSLFLVWLGCYAAIALLNIWLWKTFGGISYDLLWLEAQRRLIMDVSPPYLGLLIQAATPLPLYVAVIAGSALNAAALLGATVFTLLARQLHSANAPRIWLLLLVLQPASLFALTQWPQELVRAALLIVALLSLYAYLQEKLTYQALVGALALGAYTLADSNAWPLAFYIAVTLVVAYRRSLLEHVTVLLITLFPAVCMLLGWSWLRLMQGGALVEPMIDNGSLWQPSGSSATLVSLVSGGFVPCVVFVLAAIRLYVNRSRSRSSDRSWLAQTMLLAIPLIDMFWLREIPDTPILAVVLPLLALPLLLQPLRDWRLAQGLVATSLVIALFIGWNATLQIDSEPQRIVLQALGKPVTNRLASYQAVANELNARLQPGERVLIDSMAQAQLIPLVGNVEAFLLPQQREYPIALQLPEQWATYIVVDTSQQGLDLSNYRLVLQQDHLALYELSSHFDQ